MEFDEKGNPLPYSITGEEWGKFLCEIFDEWIKSDIYRVSIRLFDSVLAYMVANQYAFCSMGPECGQYFVVEYNGDIYPCDFFVQENLKIGNIVNGCWDEFLCAPVFTDFVAQKSKYNSQCDSCKYHAFCFGDYLKNRLQYQQKAERLSWLCDGWKIFYKHALPALRSIAEKIIANNITRSVDGCGS